MVGFRNFITMGKTFRLLIVNIVLLIAHIAKINAEELSTFEAPPPWPPTFEAPPPWPPTFEAPPPWPPTFEAPNFKAPTFEASNFKAPTFEPPNFKAPIFEAPLPETLTFEPSRPKIPTFEPQPPVKPDFEPAQSELPEPPRSKCPDPVQTKTVPTLQGRLLTIEEGCGFSNVTHRKIVGGSPAKPGTFPWITLLGYKTNAGVLSWRCGGSLITTRHVLSAAHCLKSTLYLVRLGEHDISSTTDGDVQDIDIIRVARHPNYNRLDKTNDISVIYLERDADITLRVRPICLPVEEPIRSRSFIGSNPFIAGWGHLKEGGNSSNVLQELQLPILDNSECKEQYKVQGKLLSDAQFGDAVICAGVLTGGKDSCQGDSGGPMTMPIFDANCGFRYYQIGIVSYGLGCARTDTPGVYARIQHFVDWIQEKIQQL